jgi:Polysaccharide deacetylase
VLALLPPEDQRREITSSVEAVKRLTGETCWLFAYPNGRPQDYDAETIELLRQSEISAAVCTVGGPNDSGASLMELKRYK